jgi:hypothetical protein
MEQHFAGKGRFLARRVAANTTATASRYIPGPLNPGYENRHLCWKGNLTQA